MRESATSARVPKALRLHKGRGFYATFNGTRIYFGADEIEAQEQFILTRREWIENGHRFPEGDPRDTITVREAFDAYHRHMSGRKVYTPVHRFRTGRKPIEELFGRTRAADFTAGKLRTARGEMVSGGKLCRKEINARIAAVSAAIHWAADADVVHPAVWASVSLVKPLKDHEGEDNPRRRQAD